MVKVSAAACALLAVGSVNAYSTPSRSTLRSLGSKSIPVQTSRRSDANLKMEGEFYYSWFDSVAKPKYFL